MRSDLHLVPVRLKDAKIFTRAHHGALPESPPGHKFSLGVANGDTLVGVAIVGRRAACRGADTDLWYPERGVVAMEAKAVCAACPVQSECLAFALDNGERFGVWGGKSEKQRRRLRSERYRALQQKAAS